MFKDKVIFLTGGTGSFGQKFVEILLKKHQPKAIRIFSRDELKQWEMEKKFQSDPRLRFFIGDIRDADRLKRAMEGVNIVVHAAALKQVPSCEYNPFEAIYTNIIGAQNILNTAIDHNVEKVLAVSTDKAVNPVNLYGATKMCMEKLVIAANAYVGEKHKTRMSCVRYGNVVGSRGSVVPVFLKQKESGEITITDQRMTRFWLTLEQGVEFVIQCLDRMVGGEIFVPKIESMKIGDIAEAVAPACKIKYTGIRPGEKLHECLLTADEARHAREFPTYFMVEPEHPWWSTFKADLKNGASQGTTLPEGFSYSSDQNTQWLTVSKLKELVHL